MRNTTLGSGFGSFRRGSRRPHPPHASLVRLMDGSLWLLGDKKARGIQESTPQSSSRWGYELLSLRRDVLGEPHDRGYRRLCIFSISDPASRNVRSGFLILAR